MYLRARYYDPAIGRFLSRDPLPGAMWDPGSQNAYAYAGNNPVTRADPTGMCFIIGCILIIAAAALLGGVASEVAQAMSGREINPVVTAIAAVAAGASAGIGLAATAATGGILLTDTLINAGAGAALGVDANAAINAVNGNPLDQDGLEAGAFGAAFNGVGSAVGGKLGSSWKRGLFRPNEIEGISAGIGNAFSNLAGPADEAMDRDED